MEQELTSEMIETEKFETIHVQEAGDKKEDKTGCHGYHAIVAHKETGEVETVFRKSKYYMTKALEDRGVQWAVLGVFKGKQLNVEQKASFSLT